MLPQMALLAWEKVWSGSLEVCVGWLGRRDEGTAAKRDSASSTSSSSSSPAEVREQKAGMAPM